MPRCTIESELDRPETVARAIQPDNTADVTTTVEDETVVTSLERKTTSSLEATVDDYVVNLDVATTVVTIIDQHDTQQS